MDAFQATLDALNKQSKEQITAVITAIQSACNVGVHPVRIAVEISNRLTVSQIANSFPVICLIDAMTTIKEEVCILKVLEEFWKIAPSLFVNYTKADEALRDKVSRVVKRWKAKKNFLPALGEKLLDVMNGEKMVEEENNSVQNESDNCNKGTGNVLHTGGATKALAKDVFTKSEVSGFCAILNSCAKMIKQLPPHRASMYLEVVQKEKLLDKLSKSALLFFQGLHAELKREFARYNNKFVKSEHQASGSSNGAVDTKAALNNLMTKLSKEEPYNLTKTVEGNKDNTIRILRYISPLQSDTCQRLSVGQRSGFGEWYRRAKNEFHYPKKEKNTRRPFRGQAGAKMGARVCFPSEHQWINENDMASLTLWRNTEAEVKRESSSVYSIVRKREREV